MTIPAMLSKQSGLAESVRSLWAELRNNRRAGLGLIAILVLIAVYGIVVMRGATARVEAAYAREVQRLERIAAVAKEPDWPQRAEASTALRAGLENRLWMAESEGIAQANLQAWISNVGREIGMPVFDIRIETAKPKNLPDELRQITATITAQPSEMAVVAFLERLEQAPNLTVVSRLHLRQQPGPMLELVLVGYARIGGSNAGGAK